MNHEKDPNAWLSAELAASRPHLLGVAYRMLSSRVEAEDAVQEAWLRVQRAEVTSLENPRGWLTTVVARVCLDMLRARKARQERPAALDGELSAMAAEPSSLELAGPEQGALLADSVGVALMVMLETLNPNERLAFVLHDLFDLPFEEIADVLSSTPAAARQLASRARRRMQGARDPSAEPDPERQREVVQAFLLASRSGDLAGLLAVLHPDVVLRADGFAVAEAERRKAAGAPQLAKELLGARAVAKTYVGRARAAQLALIDGRVGAVWAPEGKPRSALLLTVADGRIVAIEIVAEPADLETLEITILDPLSSTQ
jgi:RNA polymerase sigma-70 factor (ECF subfamily)